VVERVIGPVGAIAVGAGVFGFLAGILGLLIFWDAMAAVRQTRAAGTWGLP
jgi:hypothetical protein